MYDVVYWAVFVAVLSYVLVRAEAERRRRAKVRRMRERRLRRDVLNARKPRPWVQP